MALEKEKQRLSASEVLQALAGGEDIRLDECTISAGVDTTGLFHEHVFARFNGRLVLYRAKARWCREDGGGARKDRR